jgi:hypothetical protein
MRLANWLIRLGALILVLTGLAHAMGELSGPPQARNDTERQLLDLMTHYEFDIAGRTLTTGRIVSGYSWFMAATLVIIGVGAFFMMRGAATHSAKRTVAGFLVTFSAAIFVIAVIFWFIIPIAMIGLAFTCFAGGFLASLRAPCDRSTITAPIGRIASADS